MSAPGTRPHRGAASGRPPGPVSGRAPRRGRSAAVSRAVEAGSPIRGWTVPIRSVAVAALALALPLCGCVSGRAPSADIAVAEPPTAAPAAARPPDPALDPAIVADSSGWRLRLTHL